MLNMHSYSYISFTHEVGEELTARLNELGRQGWRLHTCEPIRSVGSAGSGPLEAFVVMDYATSHEEPAAEPSSGGAIAMKG